MSENEVLKATDESIQQNAEHANFKNRSKKGGPYSKNDKEKRRDEVFRLHFEYGYSARKIAELMKVNRNTINGDMDYWHVRIINNVRHIDPVQTSIVYLEQMNVQKTRLREYLDKVTNNSERMAIERLIFDIECKTLNTFQKFLDSEHRAEKKAGQCINEYLSKNNYSQRCVSYSDFFSVSKDAQEKISKIIKEDREHAN